MIKLFLKIKFLSIIFTLFNFNLSAFSQSRYEYIRSISDNQHLLSSPYFHINVSPYTPFFFNGVALNTYNYDPNFHGYILDGFSSTPVRFFSVASARDYIIQNYESGIVTPSNCRLFFGVHLLVNKYHHSTGIEDTNDPNRIIGPGDTQLTNIIFYSQLVYFPSTQTYTYRLANSSSSYPVNWSINQPNIFGAFFNNTDISPQYRHTSSSTANFATFSDFLISRLTAFQLFDVQTYYIDRTVDPSFPNYVGETFYPNKLGFNLGTVFFSSQQWFAPRSSTPFRTFVKRSYYYWGIAYRVSYTFQGPGCVNLPFPEPEPDNTCPTNYNVNIDSRNIPKNRRLRYKLNVNCSN